MQFDAMTLALDLARALRPVLTRLRQKDRDLERQLRRALHGVVLPVAEGNRRAGRDRIHLLRCAYGSAQECTAALALGEALGYLAAADITDALVLADRQRAVLYRLINR
jgi:four helix bundle protein